MCVRGAVSSEESLLASQTGETESLSAPPPSPKSYFRTGLEPAFIPAARPAELEAGSGSS